MANDTTPSDRTIERLEATETAIARMEAELAAYAEHTAKQFEDLVLQFRTAGSEWNERLREVHASAKRDSERISNDAKIPWVRVLGLAATVCVLAAGLVKYSLESRTRTLEVGQQWLAEKISLVNSHQKREGELLKELADQRLSDLRERMTQLEQNRKRAE